MAPAAIRALPVALVLASTLVLAHQEDEHDTGLTVAVVASGAVQCSEDRCLGALPVQPEIGLRINGHHEISLKFALAAGNGQNLKGPFNIAPWAADLEADVRDVNGRSRDNLLTAWYRYTAALGEGGTLETTLGIIDATDYLDDNAFANDEHSQFMNSALVNGPNAFVPSYDTGLALSWAGRRWSARTVYMNVGNAGAGDSFDYLGAQVGYRASTPLGEGNFRLLLNGRGRSFHDPTGTSLERRSAVVISCDQELGRTVGIFTRMSWRADAAAIDYDHLYSGGFDFKGRAWGRDRDNVGIGFAHLGGGNGELIRSQVFETYYRFAVNDTVAITGDVQYLDDERVVGDSPDGFVFGLRVSAAF